MLPVSFGGPELLPRAGLGGGEREHVSATEGKIHALHDVYERALDVQCVWALMDGCGATIMGRCWWCW